MTHDISQESHVIGAARTAESSWLVVELDPSRFVVTSDDVLVIERDSGRHEPARWIGLLEPGWKSSAEALIVATFRFDASGKPLRNWVPGGTFPLGEGHAWGALGLPDGWDTLVAAISRVLPVDDLNVARSSRAAIDLDRHPTLSLAPGDRFDHGELRGTVIAINRREGTIKVDAGSGVPVTIPIDAIGPKSESEAERFR